MSAMSLHSATALVGDLMDAMLSRLNGKAGWAKAIVSVVLKELSQKIVTHSLMPPPEGGVSEVWYTFQIPLYY